MRQLDAQQGWWYLWAMNLQGKLVALVNDRGLDLVTLASRCGIPYATLRAYSRKGSTRFPSADVGVRMAKALGVSSDWLFNDEADWPPTQVATPPFPVSPWPPDGITWDEVQYAITMYLLDKHLKHHYPSRALPNAIPMTGPESFERLLENLRNPPHMTRGQKPEISGGKGG